VLVQILQRIILKEKKEKILWKKEDLRESLLIQGQLHVLERLLRVTMFLKWSFATALLKSIKKVNRFFLQRKQYLSF
jgi:hypothetical protein